MQKEEIIKKYFGAWINKDIDVVKQTFSEDVIYSECYGPEYRGLWQVLQWFEDWNQLGQVLEWTIQKVISQGDTIVVDWFFKCDYKGEVGAFDGVTIADFDKDMKIVKLREFQSKAEHYYPYEVRCV